VRYIAIILGLLAISANTRWVFGEGITAGGTVIGVVGWEDAQMVLTQSFNPGAGSGGPGLAEFPAGSRAKAYLFDATSDECLYGSIQLSHSFSPGTSLFCHIHWAPITTDVTSVNWQIYYSLTPLLGTVGAATMLDISDAGDGTAHKFQTADFPEITCAACTISSIMLVELCRDANQTNGTDDMAGDVAAMSFDCHYKLNSIGSATAEAK
jgi:hypothetical protein